jgi:endonuclease/exonuclease/phosphatase family metal-dependent hydrolase
MTETMSACHDRVMRTIRTAAALLSALLSVACVSSAPQDAPLRVMTFNIRYNNPGDGEDAWPMRKEKAASMIRFHGADLVGVQEALRGQLDDLSALLPGFGWFGVGRSAERQGEYSAILYRADRFELLDQNTFWLSETPEVAGSKGWDADYERIVTWGRLRDRRTGQVFYHFNTHFDHVGETARRESARMIVARIATIAGNAPVIVTGDFNTVPESPAYQTMAAALSDAMTVTRAPHHGPTSTWNGFKEIEPGRRIDFIFVGEGVEVLQHAILSDRFDGRFPSDHLPVIAEIRVER